MYECGKRKRRSPQAAPFEKPKQLFFLVVAFGRSGFALSLSLRFRFFHGLFSFGGLLGAGFGAFLFLLVEDFLAAQQFEECLVGAVAFIPTGADDARVSALPIAKTRADRVKQLHQSLI